MGLSFLVLCSKFRFSPEKIFLVLALGGGVRQISPPRPVISTSLGQASVVGVWHWYPHAPLRCVIGDGGGARCPSSPAPVPPQRPYNCHGTATPRPRTALPTARDRGPIVFETATLLRLLSCDSQRTVLPWGARPGVGFCARGGRLRGSWDANYPCPPPPPLLGAFGQQLVAKGVTLRRPWARLRRPMLHEHQRCPKENFVQFAPQHYP
jgi:hypothetical protein